MVDGRVRVCTRARAGRIVEKAEQRWVTDTVYLISEWERVRASERGTRPGKKARYVQRILIKI